MSRLPSRARSKEQIPRKSSTRSQISTKPSTASSKGQPAVDPTVKKEFELPALSVPYRPKNTESELEKLKKKTIRRNAPPGEDLKQIKEILKSLKGQHTTVQEFLSLIGPSTGDKGEALRSVMNDDLNSFRKLARKVYETITQDNSDVLLNQQLQLSEYYRERKALLHDKMMRHIEEIYMMAPNFDFDRYAAEKEKYLAELFPIPEEIKVEPEEIEMMKRQAAYHRLQWLRSEGERLNEENNSLKKRLNQLKRMHKEEQFKMMQMERDAETKKEELEAKQAEKVETLDILNQSLEKSIIAQEASIRESKDKVALGPAGGATKKVLAKKKSKGAIKKRRRPEWNEEAAKEIESHVLEEGQAAEQKKVRSPFHFSPVKTPPAKETRKERSPFHFSPIKSPPRVAESRERSPFHYSPLKQPQQAEYQSPPRQAQQAQYQSPPRQAQRTASPQASYTRRGAQAPRDSWGGFY